MVSGNRPGIRKRPWTQAAATGAEHKRPIPRSPRSRPEPFGPQIPPYAAMRPSRVPADVAHGSGMTLPDVYLEVQHPCWSCNSSSSSPASGGRPEMGTRPGTGKRDVLLPPRPRRLLRPRGRRRARRSRRRRSAQIQRWTVSGHMRMAGSSGNGTRGLPPTGGGDRP